MCWSYVGLFAALIAETSTRVGMPWVTQHFGKGSTVVFWAIVGTGIGFSDGMRLVVLSAGAYGLPDNERAAVYGEFVRALHARFQELGCSGIEYRAGASEGANEVS